MSLPGRFVRRISVMLAAFLATTAAFAAPIEVIYVGTWQSTGSGNSTAAGGPGLTAGQKYVVRIVYDDTSTQTNNVDVLNAFFSPSGNTMSTIDLNAPGNSVDIFVPMEGLDGTTPFIYTQDETTHFPAFIPDPTLNFTDGSNTSDTNNIIGLEFEGDFVSGAGFNVIELFNTAPSGGSTNMVAQILNCGDAFCTSSSIAATSTNSLQEAVELLVDAGPDIVYDAASLIQTTSSSIIQSNDLGAGRSDGEDFIDAAWSQAGAPSGNDISVGIANSGLTSTTDTSTWTVSMTEQMTLKSDSDTLNVSYNNAGPAVEAGGNIVFSASNLSVGTSGAQVADADLAVNGIIGGFEQVTFSIDADGNALVAGTLTGATVANSVDQVISIADSGLTMTTSTSTLTVSATDNAGASSADTAVISYLNAAPTASATAIGTATGVDFTFSAADMDLIVNGIIAGFELITTTAFVDTVIDASAFFSALISTGSQSETNAALEAAFGLGLHTLAFQVTDKAGATGAVSVTFDVGDVPVAVPEPSSFALILIGLLLLIAAKRSRRRQAVRVH